MNYQLTAEHSERFWKKVSPQPGCWQWGGWIRSSGYGVFLLDARHQRRRSGDPPKSSNAHRIAYLLTHGAIPDGLQIDHLCRNRACVNPAHLEAVTQRENLKRGARGRGKFTASHCHQGHLYTPETTRWNRRGDGRQFRSCRTCEQRYWQKEAVTP